MLGGAAERGHLSRDVPQLLMPKAAKKKHPRETDFGNTKKPPPHRAGAATPPDHHHGADRWLTSHGQGRQSA